MTLVDLLIALFAVTIPVLLLLARIGRAVERIADAAEGVPDGE